MPVPGQEIVDPVNEMTISHSLQRVRDPGLGLGVIEFRGGNQGAGQRPPPGPAV